MFSACSNVTTTSSHSPMIHHDKDIVTLPNESGITTMLLKCFRTELDIRTQS